jgi:hypothetical protein
LCYDPLKFILRFVICPPNVCMRTLIISFSYAMLWYVCVYKSFRSRKVQHRASHRFRCVVVWDSWPRKLFYSRQLYTTIFVWRLLLVGCFLHLITREFRPRSTCGRRALRRLHLPHISIWTADALQTFTDKCSTV